MRMPKVTRETHRASLGVLLLVLSVGLGAAEEQVAGLQARHIDGQTILTWREVAVPEVAEGVTIAELRTISKQQEQEQSIRYLVYRSDRPIESLDGLEPLASVRPFSGWNTELYGKSRKVRDRQALRYVVDDGQGPVPHGTGIYAHNPAEAGKAYYAVIAQVDGARTTDLSPDNALSEAVEETVGPGPFILQRVEQKEKWHYVKGPSLRFYVRWESPPRCSIASKPFDYLVAVPKNFSEPAPAGLHLHCWNGSLLRGYGWWYKAEQGALLLATNQYPYDWWTGYHEYYWKQKPSQDSWQEGVVRPFTPRRLFAFLDWAGTQWAIDRSRVFLAGNSMGGSGAGMLALRYGDRVAWATSWVGVHDAGNTPRFTGSYEGVYGKKEWNIAYEDGTPVFDYYKDAWWLRRYPERETAFLTFANGKNDGGIGWPQAVEFLTALQETKRPHLFVWGQRGHSQRAKMPVTLGDRGVKLDIRIDQSLPAFGDCSLDDDPGGGDPSEGDPAGQVNLYLYWQTDDVIDEAERWAMTVALVDRAPADSCTVDVTPRRLQKFQVEAGASYAWSNTEQASGEEIASGTVTADEHGLLTLPQVTVGKAGNRLVINAP